MHIHIHIGIFICIWTCTQLVVARLELGQPNLVSASCVLMLHCVNHGLTRCNCNTIVPNFRLPLASSMLSEWLLLCFAGKVHRLYQSGTLSWGCRRSYRAGQTHRPSTCMLLDVDCTVFRDRLQFAEHGTIIVLSHRIWFLSHHCS
jgi:hypothetical protein